jgi:hypothetical protein
VTALFLLVAWGGGTLDRLTTSSAGDAMVVRVELADKAGIPATGYGPGGLNGHIGQRPHNWPQLLWLQLGVFSVPVFGVVALAVWRRQIPAATWLALLPLVVLTDEFVSVQQGHYMLAAILVAGCAGARPLRAISRPTARP